jgi:hypothetical protein
LSEEQDLQITFHLQKLPDQQCAAMLLREISRNKGWAEFEEYAGPIAN